MNPAQTSEDKSENVASKDYSLFSDSSIWYSPFQSGLDISIESDQEHGKHRSRSNSGPRIQIDSSNTQSNPNLSQLLPPSSFFESSPRTPRIMPFNQHHQENTLDIERWSTRRSPPLLASSTVSIQESDYVNPRDYFRGSQSASSSRRASIENNLTESLLCGRSRMFASSPPSSSISRPLPLSEENNGLISGSIFLPPQFNSSATPAASTVFASNPVASTPSVINHSIRTENRFSDPIEPQFPAFMNPWETNYSYQTEPTTSEAFLAFGSSSTLSTVDHATDRDRHSSLLRVMNADNRIGSNGSSEGLHHMQDKEIEREAIRQGFFFPSLAHHSNASLSSADTTSFHPYASIEMSLAAAANQPPPLFKELQYNFVELTIQDVMKNQVATEESNQIQSSPIEINEKKPKDRHRHGRSRSGHHKSASLGSFFSSGPSATDVPDSGTVDVQSNTRGTSSSNRTIHNGGLTIHSRQGRYQGHGTGKDFDGASTISGRHRTVTDQETRHKNVSKQQHFDSNSLKRSLKKDHHF
ncbi:hypothetical protein BCR41DRAFT_102522 [Lobosporangium transversale]|uniref:Uncharacterized protein n=1 Tax=Lobosporangium transversale TaxID=64571 RepID=A0A1Y2GKR4_9FUNG|nr:hypothetical protein BCR41DRAFT_102522 [Lobosporangium transversale]ORZ12576.1 hypothetical protein BCR41DRAFT_102522 [Lobosporangium transversale]|eukprot:XP_021880195.1 hypothetical protein BCR41DRAFT_102522 [Lobosporangium transversale]